MLNFHHANSAQSCSFIDCGLCRTATDSSLIVIYHLAHKFVIYKFPKLPDVITGAVQSPPAVFIISPDALHFTETNPDVSFPSTNNR